MMSIHDLPTEILLDIFRLCFWNAGQAPLYPNPYGPSEASTHFHAAAHTFSPPHVCASWRQIANASPDLYPTLSLSYGPAELGVPPASKESRLYTFLQSTSPHPISVVFGVRNEDILEGNRYGDFHNDSDVEEAVRAYARVSGLLYLLEHRHRWKSASISIPSPFLEMFFPNVFDYPVLIGLKLALLPIRSDGSVWKAGQLVGKGVVPVCAPNLEALVLQQDLTRTVELPWGGINNIRVIEFHSSSLRLDDVRVLAECKNLHTCHFSACFVSTPDPGVPILHVVLPEVRRVSCSFVLPPSMIRASPLSLLSLPRLQRLHVQWHDGWENEILELSERSSFKLEHLTLIQAQRIVHKVPLVQFVPPMRRLSAVESIGRNLKRLTLHHTDGKWDFAAFKEAMEALTLRRGLSFSDSLPVEPHVEDAKPDLFPRLQQLDMVSYTIPDDTAFVEMIGSRRRAIAASSAPAGEQAAFPTSDSRSETVYDLKTLRLRCPKTAFLPSTLEYLGNLSEGGMELYFQEWKGVGRRNFAIWNHEVSG